MEPATDLIRLLRSMASDEHGRPYCQDRPSRAGGGGPGPDLPGSCRPANVKARLTTPIFAIGFTCDRVEFEVSTPRWVGLFAQVSYEESARYIKLKDPRERFQERQAGRDPDRKLVLRQYGYAFQGKLTVFVGGKATLEAPGISGGAEAKGGAFVTIDGGGNVTDAGAKAETSAGVNVGAGGFGVGFEAEGPGGAVSFVASP